MCRLLHREAREERRLLDLFQYPQIDAGLAASIFHRKEVNIKELKAVFGGEWGGDAVDLNRIDSPKSLRAALFS